MNEIILVLQEWVLDRSGDFIFWAPIVLLGAAVFFAWALSSFKGFNILGWTIAVVSVASAIFTWTTVWDWRADEYTNELQKALSEGVVLNGDTVTGDRVSADAFGIVNVDLNLSYELGYSDVFMIGDVEDFIDYLVLDYRVSENSDNSYISIMRDFQELHVNIASEEVETDDVLSYHKDTLVSYADNVTIREVPGNGTVEEGANIADTDYSIMRGGDTESPWNMRDQQGSDEGVSLGQWAVLDDAPNTLLALNNLSCSALNGFSECSEETTDGNMGPPANHHSVILAGVLLVLVIVFGSILDFMLRKFSSRMAKSKLDETRDIGYEDTEKIPAKKYVPRHTTNKES